MFLNIELGNYILLTNNHVQPGLLPLAPLHHAHDDGGQLHEEGVENSIGKSEALDAPLAYKTKRGEVRV